MKRALGIEIGAIFFLLLSCFLKNFSFADEPTDILKQRETYLESIKDENPKLYEFEKKIASIKGEIQAVMEKIQRKQMTKEEAREALTPLFKELISIQQNPDYLLEQQLFSILGQSSISE